MANCKKGERSRKALLLEMDESPDDQNGDSKHTPDYDGSELEMEEVIGDHVLLLVVWWVCLAPQETSEDS